MEEKNFQPPPPYLPDLLHSPNVPVSNTMMPIPFPRQTIIETHDNDCSLSMPIIQTNDRNDFSTIMDYNMGVDQIPPVNHQHQTMWTSADLIETNSSSNFADELSQGPPNQSLTMQLSEVEPLPATPAALVIELQSNMTNDPVVLSNALCVLFSKSIKYDEYSRDVCLAMSASREILDMLFKILRDDQFQIQIARGMEETQPVVDQQQIDFLIYLAAGNLTNMSRYDEGRRALLERYDCDGNSIGVRCFLRCLHSKDINVVYSAIFALHRLLCEQQPEMQEMAKEQILNQSGIRSIVSLLLLNSHSTTEATYQFQVIVLDCLQILTYRNDRSRMEVAKSNGPCLLLQTIEKNLDHTFPDHLIETASRVLKSLSACLNNKPLIIENGGIDILYKCLCNSMNIEGSKDILKTVLWTIRNLSDLINQKSPYIRCIKHLAEKIISILIIYANEPSIVACSLGIFANLTCNNEDIKQLSCDCNGVQCLMNTIQQYSQTRNIDVLEPAFSALSHLTNISQPRSESAKNARSLVANNLALYKSYRNIHPDLTRAIDKLLINMG